MKTQEELMELKSELIDIRMDNIRYLVKMRLEELTKI